MSLMKQSLNLQADAAVDGFEWEHTDHAFDKIMEEIAELREAYDNRDNTAMTDELGDVFYALISFARVMNIDPEASLEHAHQKFFKRFEMMCAFAREDNVVLKDLSPQAWRDLWQRAKRENIS